MGPPRLCTGASTSGRGHHTGAGICTRALHARSLQERSLVVVATSKGKSTGSRNAGLYELMDEDWGVEVPASSPPSRPSSAPAARANVASAGSKRKQTKLEKKRPVVGQESTAQDVGLRQDGLIGLAMLQQALEAGQADGLGLSPEDLVLVKEQMALAADSKNRNKLPALQSNAEVTQRLQELRKKQERARRFLDDEEEEDEELMDGPDYQLTLGEDGAEFTDFTAEEGNNSSSSMPGDGGDFDMFGWEQFDADEDADEATGPEFGSKQASRQLGLLKDLSGEDDWGLEGFEQRSRPGSSLIQELMAAEQQKAKDGLDVSSSGQVLWGGTGGVTGIDLEEQEQLLQRYFRPDQVKKLMKHQREIDREYVDLKRRSTGALPPEHKLHRELRIIGGSAAGKRLLSSRGAQTRPMMDKVRQAVFNSVLSWAGSVNVVPPGSRWLDLFAGTGSVGLEALSRGASECHFVEMDPWVIKKVLSKNISTCGFNKQAITHTGKAEEFLQKSRDLPRFAGGAFDFISMCPPYLLVSYPELYDLLEGSPLVHSGTILFVEFPKQLQEHVRDRVGPLQKVRVKSYGRTWVATYAGAAEQEDLDGDADEVSALLSG